MGLSVSAAAAVFAIGFSIIALILVDSLTDTYQELDDATTDRSDRERRLLDTAMELESAVYNTTGDNLTLVLENSGSSNLRPGGLDVLADGLLVTGNVTGMKVGGAEAEVWFPGEVMTVTVKLTLKPSRVMVITDNGVAVVTADIASEP